MTRCLLWPGILCLFLDVPPRAEGSTRDLPSARAQLTIYNSADLTLVRTRAR